MANFPDVLSGSVFCVGGPSFRFLFKKFARIRISIKECAANNIDNFVLLTFFYLSLPNAVAPRRSDSFSLKKSIESLRPNQLLDIPPGNYTSTDCGVVILSDNVIIKASRSNVLIDCAGKARHFFIISSNVTIEGLLLVNGASEIDNCASDRPCDILNGGCMLIYGNQTVVRDSMFVNCTAVQNGGAICISNVNSRVSLERVGILSSQASSGGGVWSPGVLDMDNCSLTFNTASLEGGALLIQGPGAYLNAQNTIFNNNTAWRCGGGISMMVRNSTTCVGRVPNGGVAVLSGVTMQNNWAATCGGAIFFADGFSLSLEGNATALKFEKNSASRGGAIFALFSILRMQGNVVFSENAGTVLGDAGAMRLGCKSTLEIFGGDVRFVNNTSYIQNQGFGGAIYLSDPGTTANISGNVSFVSNQALAGFGGAIYVQTEAVCYVSGNVSFFQNVALVGGAMSCTGGGKVDISGDVEFIENEASVAGALEVEYSFARVAGSAVFAGNRGIHVSSEIAAAGGVSSQSPSTGGAIYTTASQVECLGNVSFENNTADQGGAVYVDAGADFSASGYVTFRGCVAASGGAFYLRSGTARLEGQAIVEVNVALSGGGLLARSVSNRLNSHAPLTTGYDLSLPFPAAWVRLST